MDENNLNNYILCHNTVECLISLKCTIEYENEYDHFMNGFCITNTQMPNNLLLMFTKL